MKVAFLILTYKYPEQLDKLIEIMSIDEFKFFVHLDKKIDYKYFDFISARSNVIFIKNRVEVTWGSSSMNNAIVESYKEILKHDEYDYINVITSHHLPLKPSKEILKHLSENKGYQFLNAIPYNIENSWWKRCEKRILKYSFVGLKFKGKYRIETLINNIVKKRRLPAEYVIAGSPSSYFFTSECVKFIVNEFNTNKKLINFFKYVWGPDEFIFATLIYNSKFKTKIKDCLVYIEFKEENDGHSKIMQTNDYNKLKMSGKFFAKKFDPYVDSQIITLINKLRNGDVE
jgi:hypothetical protein